MSEADNHSTDTSGMPSCGAMLREAREAQGLSVAEAAAKLHLHQRIVEALEEDDRNRLPLPIYVRGYLRNYARLVGLDAQAVLAAYEGSETDDDDDEHSELRPPLKAPNQASSSDKPVKAVTYLLTLGLVVLLLAWWQSRHLTDESPVDLGSVDPEATATGPAEDATTPADDALGYPIEIVRHPDSALFPLNVPADREDAGTSEPAGSEPPAHLLDTMPDVDTGDRDASADPADAVETIDTVEPGANGDAPGSEMPAGEEGLVLELSEESWIEVYDADGERLYIGLGQPGERISLEGAAPLRVRLGFAPGVSVRYNGEPVATDEYSSAGVAQFHVGN